MNYSLRKNVVLMVLVMFMGLLIAGGTFAYLTYSANITNGNYVAETHCFNVDYNIDNGDNTQDIVGTLFPSLGPTRGLNGRVGLKVNDECEVNGIGTIKLHINSESDSHLTEIATSHCEDKKTGDILTEYTTEASCSSANQSWKSYPTSYCESNSTLQTLKDYTTSASCTANNGTWVTNGSPLKYAVYNTNNTNGSPVKVGHITSSDIGNDITIYDNFLVSNLQSYYYVYIWLDGYLTDNTHADLPFGGYITANAIQDEDASNYYFVEYIESTGTQYLDTGYIPKINTKMELSLSFDGEFKGINTYGGGEVIFKAKGSNMHQINFGGSQDQWNKLFIWINPNVKVGSTETIAINENILRNKNILSLQTSSISYGTVSRELSPKVSDSTESMILFGSANVPFTCYNMLVYDLKFYENNNLVRHYVPCYRKSDSVRGMYDIVNGGFYTNAGDGTFKIPGE